MSFWIKRSSTAGFFIVTVILLIVMWFRYTINDFRIINIFTKVGNKNKIKGRVFNILLYTKYFGGNWEQLYPVKKLMTSSECPSTNCAITDDEKEIHSSDIIMFHGNDLPSPRDIRKISRNPLQIWIFMTQENPFTVNTGSYKLKDYNALFNWTATYSLKANVVTPYFDVLERTNQISPSNTILTSHQNKTKLVMSIMSNCIDFRVDFVKRLKQYVNVDLYGACKYLVNPTLDQCEKETNECEELQAEYKFFLAIENSYCTDYVTEKFYEQALMKGLVPIVLSGGKFSNRRIAPPYSYINILDFSDLKSLGEYIQYLDSNKNAYDKYHEWRKTYKIESHDYLCNLCKTLNKKYNVGKIWKGKNLREVWNEKSCKRFRNEMFQKYLK